MIRRKIILSVLWLASLSTLSAAAQMTPALRSRIDTAVEQTLVQTGVPSAEVGIVMDGRIVMTAAYGDARLGPAVKALPAMHYPVGSISKQFTAAAVLLLAEEGKLSLDDHVARFFPELTRASEVTLRELLSHTSGYEDYAPQDYTIPLWTRPVKPLDLIHLWAEKPLDFDPGTQWQYSNTNFVLAALIVEKASGMPYWTFMQQRVLSPLGLKDVLNLDTDRQRVEPLGYMRNAFGPLRPAAMEGPGWYFGDASLAMPVEDLLRWDISIIDRTLLKPASYDTFETEVRLKDGAGSGYGLGVSIKLAGEHRMIEHSGEVGGFVAENVVYPDDRVALAVLTNEEASSAAGAIARAVGPLLFMKPPSVSKPADTGKSAAEEQVKQILTGLLAGSIDRSLFTDDANFYFSPLALGDFKTSLGPLGPLAGVSERHFEARGGMLFRVFTAQFAARPVTLTTYTMPDGKLEQFLIEP